MQNTDNKSSKMSLQSKLRLKINNSDSSECTSRTNIKSCSNSNTNSQESYSNNQPSCKESSSSLPNVEDSMADFKSPKKETAYGLVLNKFKIDAEKPKKKITKSKTKSSSKSTKSGTNIKQPSIESSFFKPQTSDQNDMKESMPCPLCLKPFKDDTTCMNHMKACAAKKNISTKQLFEAIRLQDRQAEERKSLGLLAAPVLPERKKVFRSKNFSTGDDPQLQLVLAMSESLYQAKQMEEFEQAALLAGIPSECIKDMNDEDRRTTLQTFGFTTTKPVNDIPVNNRSRKRKLLGPTILQTRSKEDKDRVLTERIACILTGDDALTQVQKRPEVFPEQSTPTVLRSKILKKIEKSNNRLWDRSRLTKKYLEFYVEELKSYLFPSNDQIQETGLVGCEHLFERLVDNENTLLDTSILYEPIDIGIIVDENKEQNNSQLTNFNESCTSESGSMNSEQSSIKTVIMKWGEALNDSAASDVIIFVKDNKHIYAHKLVFHVQCSDILLHVEPNDTDRHLQIKNKLCWFDKDHLSALAFLEFIYCGTIKKYINFFDDDDLVRQVRRLARLYKVKELFSYLRKKQNTLTAEKQEQLKNVTDFNNTYNDNNRINVNSHRVSTSAKKCNNSNKEGNFHEQLTQSNQAIQKFHSDPTPTFEKRVIDNTISKHLSMNNYNERRITASPDMFASEDEEAVYSNNVQTNYQSEKTQSNINIKSVDLTSENENNLNNSISITNQPQTEVDCTDEQMNSQKTVINLSRTPSPHISLCENDIYRAVTPKCRSPEKDQELGADKIDTTNEQINEAITPKYGRSPERYTKSKKKITQENNSQIFEAVTPKNRSPERSDNNTSKDKRDYQNDRISEALTPKHNRSPEYFSKHITNRDNYSIDQICRAVTPEANELKVNNYVTPKNPVYAEICDSVSEEINKKGDDSMYTAVTPPKCNGRENFNLNSEQNLQKLRTDLSLFIEKVQRENAKGILDTDSETDTPEIPKRLRDPFIKRLRNDSYAYLQNDGGNTKEDRRVISLLEREVLDGEKKSKLFKKMSSGSINKSNSKSLQNSEDLQNDFARDDAVTSEKSQTSCPKGKSNSSARINQNNDVTGSTLDTLDDDHDDDLQELTIEDTEISMYSRYKKNHEKDNSIAKYRSKLNFHSKLNHSSEKVSDDSSQNRECNNKSNNNLKKELFQKSTMTQKPKNVIDVTLVSDSDEENQSNSSITANVDNITDYNSCTQIKEKDIELENSESALANIENDSTIPLSAIDDQFEQSRNSSIKNSTALNKKSKSQLIDLSVDSDEEGIHDDSTVSFRLAAESDSSLNSKKSHGKNFSEEKSNNKESYDDSEKKTDDVDAEISKILQSSPEVHKNDEHVVKRRKTTSKKFDQSKKITSMNAETEVINLSPISIISSPEYSPFEKDDESTSRIQNSSNSNKRNNSNERSATDLNAFENECFDDIEFDDDWNLPSRETSNKSKKTSPESVLDISASKKKLIFDHLSSKNTSSPISPRASTSNYATVHDSNESVFSRLPVLSQSRKKSRVISGKSPATSPSKSKKKANKSPEDVTEDLRKLKTKSVSASSVTETTQLTKRHSLQRSTSFVSPKPNKKLQESSNLRDAIPPADYSMLGTPDLQKELDKYGLKPQSREKAKLLLRHIYNQMHSVAQKRAPTSPVAQKRAPTSHSLSEDEEPPPKKKNVKKVCRRNETQEKRGSHSRKSSSNCRVIAEEMEYDEPDAANNLENPVSIKEAFLRLIQTNKVLYTKVLTYEPLPLESLHSMLKQTGLKCKINDLMDYLDEQCITFQVQTGKGSRTKKKKCT